MGYQVVFVPPEEKMKAYETFVKNDLSELLQSQIIELVHYCMKDRTEYIHSMSRQIKNSLKSIKTIVFNSEKKSAYERWKEDEDHELWYSGWEYSKPPTFELNNIIDDTTETLLMYADVIKTADWYSEEEKFYQKWNAVKSEIDGFIEIITELAVHEIIDDLKEFKKKYEEE